MRFFFKSRKFKIAAATVAVILVLAIVAWVVGGILAPQSNLAGTIIAPFQKMIVEISHSVEDFSKKIGNNQQLIMQNAELQQQLNDANEKIIDYDEIKSQNEFYKKYLEIKSANPDFQFADAVIISRDNTDEYGGFTIDKGTLSDIQAYDPVITDAGLIGYISEVGLTTAKVTTILSPDISVGVLDSRTRDAGVISGELSIAANGITKMHNLQRSSTVAVGDYIVTSGSGVFPAGLPVGKIIGISQGKNTTSLYAEVEPFVNIREERQVMIITAFSGQNHIQISGEK